MLTACAGSIRQDIDGAGKQDGQLAGQLDIPFPSLLCLPGPVRQVADDPLLRQVAGADAVSFHNAEVSDAHLTLDAPGGIAPDIAWAVYRIPDVAR